MNIRDRRHQAHRHRFLVLLIILFSVKIVVGVCMIVVRAKHIRQLDEIILKMEKEEGIK